VPAVLNDIISRDYYRNFHFNGIVDRGPKVNILAQYNDGLYLGPAASYFLDVACDPDTACAVDHLLFDDPAGLAVKFTQEYVASSR
jgi:hypothetical protein